MLGPNSLAAAIGANLAINDRSLCPNGRGLTQSETSIAVAGNVVVAAFNDSRGVCMPDLHAAIGWGFSLDIGNSWTDWWPSVSVDADGTVNVVYLDR